MMTKRNLLFAGASAGVLGVLGGLFGGRSAAETDERFEVTKSEEEWKKILTREQFSVLRKEGTEPPGTSSLLAEKREGTFNCAACDLPLYSSDTKYESGTGWPSFWEALPDSVSYREDNSLFMRRTEVHCRRCGGHLGHVFDDGPQPTGKRHCINGVALKFAPAAAA